MKKSLVYIVIAFFALVSCKPTEDNYRKAYEAAKNKREAANAEAMMPATGILNDDGPMRKIVEGDTLYISRDRLRRDSVIAARIKPYNVAVGIYKMSTNAKAQARSLSEEGYDAFAAQTTGERWYTIAGGFQTVSEASAFIKEFRNKHREYPYIGLPSSPIIIGK